MNTLSKPTLTPREICAYRTSISLDQRQFAILIGVTPQAVMLWEQGDRRCPETTVRLIKLFQKFPQLVKEF